MKAQNFNYLQKVIEPLRDLGHKFGSSISIDGNFAVVGAPNSSDIARTYWGAAYIFEKTNNNWVFRQRIVFSDSAMRGGEFGYSVCIKGNQIIVGDPQKDLNFYSPQIGPVIVRANAELFLTVSTVQPLQPCNYMWRSITVQPGGRLYLKDCSIRGGQYAVEAFHKSTIRVRGCTFTDNFIGIYVPPATNVNPQQVNISPFSFFSNRFTSSNQGLPNPFPGHPNTPTSPIAGSLGFAGMLINDMMNLDIRQRSPVTVADANNFRNLASGIVGVNSSINIDGCIFRDINQNNPYLGSARYIGTALYLSGNNNGNHTLFQNGYGTTGTYNFQDVHRAIAVTRAHAAVANNRMRRAGTGVSTLLCKNRNIIIIDNYIEALETGIALFQNEASSTNALVRNNEVFLSPTSNFSLALNGIIVTESNTAYPLTISENTIRINNAPNGLVLQGNSKGVIIENNIRLQQNHSFRTGFFSTGSQYNTVSCNDITGTSVGTIGTLNQRGYWITGSSGDYTCNTADNLPVGMQFDASNNMNLRGTRFNRHYYGLWLRPGARIGQQSNTGNRFITNTPNNVRREAINQSNPFLSIFIVNAPQNTSLWPSPVQPTSNPQNTGWFRTGGSSDFDCNSPFVFCPSGPVLRPTPTVNNLDTLVATGALTTGSPQVNEFMGKRQLYRKLKESGNPGGLFQSFSSAEASTPVGLFDRISELSDSLCRPDSICMHNANALQVAINQYIAQIRTADSLYNLNGNAQHLAQISVLQDSLSSKAAQENLIWSNIQNIRQSTADMLDIDNSTIPVSAIHEDNEKKVNEVYLNTISKGNFDYSASHLSLLESVASQCPWEGGNAVFRARGMLALVQRVIINDESMCNSVKSLIEYSEEPNNPETEVIETNFIKIYPNPTNNYLNIEAINSLIISTVEVFNLAGQKMIEFNNKERQFTQIEVGHLQAGLYICKVITANNEIHSFKFSVIK